MGLFIAMIRKHELIRQKHSAEYDLTDLTLTTRKLQNVARNLDHEGEVLDLDPDTKDGKLALARLKERQAKLKEYETQIMDKKSAIEERLKAIDAELQSCQSMIDSNIQAAFSYQVK